MDVQPSRVVEVDYAVVGVGTMGSMALWQLSELAPAGSTILGIEQFGRIHTRGSYTGESRLFRVALKEGQEFVSFAQQARQLWLDLNEKSGRDVFLPIGALSIGPADYRTIVATQEAIDEFALPHEYFNAEQLRQRFPQFSIDDTDIGILDPQGGAIRPEVAVATATQQALNNGAQLWTHTKVIGVDKHGCEGIVLRTDRGTVKARHAIFTLGSWAGELFPELRAAITVRPLVLTWFMPRTPAAFLPDTLPIFLYDKPHADGTSFHIYGAPSIDGFSVKFSTELLSEVRATHPDDIPATVSDQVLNAFAQRVAETVTDFYPDVARLSMHHDGFTSTGHAIIDTQPDQSFSIAVGMSGTGMKFAPYFGQLAARLALSGDTQLRPDFLSMAAHLS
ncbi:FAD-dependent oxidoreductase [Corynebacterium sp. sy017]|uniref:FAD-dependent oxidoreductase n=1 Tax=unclassified Corynebacterium TaxID=2624378 RepID=UPI001184C57A|nr:MULTISPECIES: FAD-dependent oxidoreductase [unclassified Corynebacterium]MBP3088153.1 FAD-dependent oxidoreductase [Corynebacterium sp. sy017]QDZ43090.1 FAD-dependent oxidoreductase [Corynebacterium sp. sy039]TSD92663.1 FAD-dependent oxidoreductase [Corynebacterium sp. SY003]